MASSVVAWSGVPAPAERKKISGRRRAGVISPERHSHDDDNDRFGYTYDPDNRLTAVEYDYDGDGIGLTAMASYRHDAQGRRIEYVDCTNNVTTRYYYEGPNVIMDVDETNATQRTYVNGTQYVDERVLMRDYEATSLPPLVTRRVGSRRSVRVMALTAWKRSAPAPSARAFRTATVRKRIFTLLDAARTSNRKALNKEITETTERWVWLCFLRFLRVQNSLQRSKQGTFFFSDEKGG
jgi:hypothetical protein